MGLTVKEYELSRNEIETVEGLVSPRGKRNRKIECRMNFDVNLWTRVRPHDDELNHPTRGRQSIRSYDEQMKIDVPKVPLWYSRGLDLSLYHTSERKETS